MSAPPAPALDSAAFAALMAPLGPFEAAPQVAVAVSGGADSLALALLGAGWAAERGGHAVALTVDHGLRPESAAEARQVRAWLKAHGIRHHTLVWEGPRPTADLQAAARTARYRLLAAWCASRGVLHLLLAHHRDDQAETLLLRLARGSGLDGLAGMAAITEPGLGGAAASGPRLLRPLLGVPKAALEASLRDIGQSWIEDPSNASDAFARARLRRKLPDLAAEGLTPERLAATAARLGRARAALDDAVAGLAARAVGLFPAGYARLDLSLYREAAPEIALRCLARCLMTIGGGTYTPRLERLERLHHLLVEPAPAGPGDGAAQRPAVRTLAGCRIERRRDAVLVCREAADGGGSAAVAAGQAVWWDGRFLLRLDGRGRCRLGRLGGEGWLAALRQLPELRRTTIPAPVRPTLPALWDDHGLLEAPHLGFRRAGARGPRVAAAEFVPAQPLAPARFMVV
jgi:tRNA(Ile)-lysidine synthase